ncbi:MAG TPA: hypothetical protein VK348_14290 [Planctomycetota bacterium]|nr:hypothetical protein [Planctomycetota bacterium]
MHARLLAGLVLAAAAAAQTPTVNFTNFGRPCDGTLTGSLARGPSVQMDVAGAPANAIAILAIGHPATTGIALPGSSCLLLVEPRATMLQLVDARGNSTFHLRLPPIVPLSVDFQEVSLGLLPRGVVAVSTNGVNMTVR